MSFAGPSGGRAFSVDRFIYVDFALPVPKSFSIQNHQSQCIALMGQGAKVRATYNISVGAGITSSWSMLVNGTGITNNLDISMLITKIQHVIGDIAVGRGAPALDVQDALSPSNLAVLPSGNSNNVPFGNSGLINTSVTQYVDGSFISLGDQFFYSLWLGSAFGVLTPTISQLEIALLGMFCV